ncbi:MAG: pknB 19 [Verrucomicrobiales bacterium]|nr:pknB 19 [Verrucomicrobiales bacterium]
MAKKFETTSLRAHRQRDLFIKALEIEHPGERRLFLERECGNDSALKKSVLDLLGASDEADEFMARAAVAPPAPAPGSDGKTLVLPTGMFTPAEKPGDHIGPYKILQQIGEGGCGVVYMAEQERPVRRRIALKVIKLGMDTRSVIARFEAERQALAMMDHPNIAKVLDAGTTEKGRPYFVMELVRGIKITDYCDQGNLSTEDRLRLFILVCNAIQHAHQKGVIHRDIKPSNILVTLHDGLPVPKVIDFGIAKAIEQRLTDKTLFTEFHSFIGTPAYMSPEQAEMSGLDIDTRSDIYSLGVLLYQLLTDTTPFDSETLMRSGLDECRRIIREKEPPRPSTRLQTMVDADLTTTANHRRVEPGKLIHLLRGDVDWIVMKCLEKNRTRRYGTATDLARDVQRYLENDEVQARPPSTIYKFGKLVSRHRTVFFAGSAVAIALVAGAGFSTWQAFRAIHAEKRAEAGQKLETDLRKNAEEEWERAEREKSSAHLNEYIADMNLAQQALIAGNLGRAIQLVEKHFPEPGEPDLRGFEWRYLWELCQGDEIYTVLSTNKSILSLAYSPDGTILAAGLPDSIFVINLHTRSLITSLDRGAASLAFSNDGKLLVSAAGGGFRPPGFNGPRDFGNVHFWETSSWTKKETVSEASGPLEFSRDGKLLAMLSTSRSKAIKVLNAETLKLETVLTNLYGPFAFSPDGARLVADSRSGLIIRSLFKNSESTVLGESSNLFFQLPIRDPRSLSFSMDGKFVVAPHNIVGKHGVYNLGIWNADTGEEVGTIPNDPERIEHTGLISAVSFSPDGATIASASFDHSIRLWNFQTHDRIATLQGHRGEVWSLAFAADGKTLATGSKEGSVKIWGVRGEKKEDTWTGFGQPLSISSDGRMLASLARTTNGFWRLSFINMVSREIDLEIDLEKREGPGFGGPFGGPGQSFGFSSDFSKVVLLKREGRVEVRYTDGRKNEELKGPEADALALSPDGRTLLTWKRFPPQGQRLTFWNLSAGTNFTSNIEPGGQVLFSPSSDSFLTFQRTNAIQIWDTQTKALRTTVVIDQPEGRRTVTYSQNGKLLAVPFSDDSVHLFEVATGKFLVTLAGHKQPVIASAFAPDNQTIATSGADSTLKFWNVATGQELLSFRKLGEGMQSLFFSPDGKLLIGAVGGGNSSPETSIRFYHARSLNSIDSHRSLAADSPMVPKP